MRITRAVVVGVALVAGLATAFLVRHLVQTPAPQPPVVQVTVPAPVSQVLVAARDLTPGTTVKADDFKWQAWPKDAVPAGAIQQSDRPTAGADLTGSIVRSSFVAGELANSGKLINAKDGFMSAILPAGKRAVATAISADTSAGGFILPNDRVDVIMTRKVDSGNGSGERFATETVLANVRVLAIDQNVQDKNGEKVVVGQTATLELTDDQAKILTVAQQMSQRLTLALRSLADASDHSVPDAEHLINGGSGMAGIRLVRNGITKQIEAP